MIVNNYYNVFSGKFFLMQGKNKKNRRKLKETIPDKESKWRKGGNMAQYQWELKKYQNQERK